MKLNIAREHTKKYVNKKINMFISAFKNIQPSYLLTIDVVDINSACITIHHILVLLAAERETKMMVTFNCLITEKIE